jgi:hypothetical protein
MRAGWIVALHESQPSGCILFLAACVFKALLIQSPNAFAPVHIDLT